MNEIIRHWNLNKNHGLTALIDYILQNKTNIQEVNGPLGSPEYQILYIDCFRGDSYLHINMPIIEHIKKMAKKAALKHITTIAINVHSIKIITHNFNHPPPAPPPPNTLAQNPLSSGNFGRKFFSH